MKYPRSIWKMEFHLQEIQVVGISKYFPKNLFLFNGIM